MENTAGWVQRGSALALTMIAMMAAGCGGGGGGDGGGTSSATSTGNPANRSPTIAATPATQAAVGTSYALSPTVADADGDTLAFSIQNRPSWATFNTTTGQLTGTPSAQDVGAYADVLISVSDGSSTAALPAFTITVGTTLVADAPSGAAGAVTLQWEAPTLTTAGTPLSGLAGFRIHYGKSAEVLDSTIIVSNAGTLAYSVADLEPGTYFFAVKAVDSHGGESALSNVRRLIVS